MRKSVNGKCPCVIIIIVFECKIYFRALPTRLVCVSIMFWRSCFCCWSVSIVKVYFDGIMCMKRFLGR